MTETSSIKQKTEAQPASIGKTLIATKNIAFTRGGKTRLHSVDIDIRAGEIITVIGPNGAGKTTLLKLLLGILKPTSGEISRRPNLTIGYVPQKFDLDKTIPLTVKRFIALKSGSSLNDAHEALKRTGAEDLLDRQIAELSGGEFQRVVLARAITGNPDLLILDEPVQGVDYAGEADLYRLIEQIRNEVGCAILLVSHDLHIVMAASDHIICINQHVCCSGIPEKVAMHPEYQRMFGQDAAGAIALYRHSHDHRHDISGSITASHEGCDHDHDANEVEGADPGLERINTDKKKDRAHS